MAKTRAVVKNLKKAERAVSKLFTSTIQREAFLVRIRDFSLLRIQAETRKGNDLSTEGKIKDVSTGWRSFKRSIEQGDTRVKPKKSEFLTSRRSNLSITGQLLDSLKGKMLATKGQVEVRPTGNREKTEFQTKRRSKYFSLGTNFRSNQELADDLASRGWTFLGMDKKGVQRIRRMVLDEFRRSLRTR